MKSKRNIALINCDDPDYHDEMMSMKLMMMMMVTIMMIMVLTTIIMMMMLLNVNYDDGYLVMKVIIVKEVISFEASPLAMFPTYCQVFGNQAKIHRRKATLNPEEMKNLS